MRPHPRLRKTIKWTGAAATLLLIVVWIASGWFHAGRITPDQIDMLRHGRLMHEYLRVGFGSPIGSGWGVSQTPRWELGFEFKHDNRGYTRLCLPLWAPSLLAASVTIVAWRLDTLARRRAARALNLCPTCTYDRAGLAPRAVCPECGTPAPAA